MAVKHISLYTVQNPQRYVRENSAPDWVCKQNRWTFIEMARYLGWNYWSWTFPDTKDFKNEWIDLEKVACQKRVSGGRCLAPISGLIAFISQRLPAESGRGIFLIWVSMH
jgi:hypothetical protein